MNCKSIWKIFFDFTRLSMLIALGIVLFWLQFMKLSHFVIVLCLFTTKLAIGQLARTPQTEAETSYYHDMGVRTAKQTWWFFRSKLDQKANPNYSFHRIFLESYQCWLKDISYHTSGKWSGTIDPALPFDPSLDVTTQILFDSIEIDDWMLVENNTLIGGFTLRHLETKKFKTFLKACDCFEGKSAVNQDFVSESKELLLPNGSAKDTTSRKLMDSIYIGGYNAFFKQITENLEFTEYASRLKIEGNIYISFTINNKGELTSLKVLQGIGGGLSDNAKQSVKSACEHFRKDRTDNNSHHFIQNVVYDCQLTE